MNFSEEQIKRMEEEYKKINTSSDNIRSLRKELTFGMDCNEAELSSNGDLDLTALKIKSCYVKDFAKWLNKMVE